MRRLQGNLTYLAALADRKGGQLPPCPAHLMAPALSQNIKMRSQPPAQPDSNEKQLEPNADREERNKFIREMYKRLQGLFPGIDPNREPAFQMRGGQGQHQQQQQHQQHQQPNQNGPRSAGAQASNQGSPTAAAPQALRGPQGAGQTGNMVAPPTVGST